MQNNGGNTIPVPITMPEGTKVLGLLGLPAGAFGTAYAGERSEQRSDGLAGIGRSSSLPSGAAYPIPPAAVQIAPKAATSSIKLRSRSSRRCFASRRRSVRSAAARALGSWTSR